MGFWNEGWTGSRTEVRRGSRSRSRSGSRSPSGSRPRTHRATSHTSSKHYSSRPSYVRSASSFFSIGGGGGGGSQSGGNPRGSTGGRSYTSPRPRTGFVARVRKFLRQIYDYMRRHPFKVFFLVIMPLITGGALAKLLAVVGIKLPRGLENVLGSSMNRGVPDTQRYFARGGARDFGGGSALPGMGVGVGEAVQGALGIAKMFM